MRAALRAAHRPARCARPARAAACQRPLLTCSPLPPPPPRSRPPQSTPHHRQRATRARARARGGYCRASQHANAPPCSGGDDCAPGKRRWPRPMEGCTQEPPACSSQVKTSCARRVGAQGACRRVNPPRMLPTRPPPPPPPRSLAHADVGVRQGAGTGSTQSSPTPTSDDDARPAATRANTPTRPPSSEAAVQPWAQP